MCEVLRKEEEKEAAMANQKIDALLTKMDAAAGRAAAAAGSPEMTVATRRHAEAASALGLSRQRKLIEQADKAAHAERLGFTPMTREQAVAAMAPGREVVAERRSDEFRARRRAFHLLLLLPAAAGIGVAAVTMSSVNVPIGGVVGALVALMMLCPWDLARTSCGLRFVATDLDRLKDPVPLGVLLRVAELKKLRVFDEFEVIAPAEMTDKPWVGKDPIVLGRCGHRSFFVARWDPRMG